MILSEEKRTVKLPHNLIMENRAKLNITGVSQVDSFDEQTVVLITDMGELTVKGSNLHISQLNVDTGELNIDGSIYGLVYADSNASRGGFLTRLFK
ncbi:MAG: sporulation protein YabP [Clostridia bacterium]|nr:sporulation protein YabP [Clostridia bacterium]